jgi:hypothetical protein
VNISLGLDSLLLDSSLLDEAAGVGLFSGDFAEVLSG